MALFYENLFSSSVPGDVGSLYDDVVRGRVTDEMKIILEEDFTREEVWMALKQMKPLAAPGPDGLPSLLYQRYWLVVGLEVADVYLGVLNHGMDPSAGRIITNNELIAFDSFHYMKKKRKGKHGVVGLKLDMAKVYDRIE